MKCEKCGKPVKGGYYNTPYGVFCVDCWENKTDEKVKEDCEETGSEGTEEKRYCVELSKDKVMKQTVEEAAKEYYERYKIHLAKDIFRPRIIDVFKAGAEWQKEQAIEALSSILDNWVHGGDADCIIAEFEEKLK